MTASAPRSTRNPGGPCEGELTCEYQDDIFFWTYRCESGAWTAEPRCGGGCPVPPLSELCIDPFQGTLEGAEVTIGPASFAEPFRAFEEAELVDPIWGPQRSAMIAVRPEVTGAGAPDCVAVDTGLEVEGSSAQHSLARDIYVDFGRHPLRPGEPPPLDAFPNGSPPRGDHQ